MVTSNNKKDWYNPEPRSKDDKYMSETGNRAEYVMYSSVYEAAWLILIFLITTIYNVFVK